MLETTN